MARVIPPGFAEASQELRLDNYPRSAFVTWGMKISGTDDGEQDIAQRLYAQFVLSWATRLDSNVTMGRCRVIVGQDGGEPLVFEYAGQAKGTASRESTPPAIAVLISKNTNLGGRRNRGRLFMPWAVAENQVTETGTIIAAGLTGLQASADSWLANLEQGETTQSLFDGMYLLHGEFLGAPTKVTSLTVSPIVSTQKRRQSRR